MVQLDDLLARLNRQIDAWNADLSEAVDRGEVSVEDAAQLRVEPNSATVDMVRGGVFTEAIVRALGDVVSEEHPNEIVRMVKTVRDRTELMNELLRGASNSKRTRPVLVPTLSLAHLVAQAG